MDSQKNCKARVKNLERLEKARAERKKSKQMRDGWVERKK